MKNLILFLTIFLSCVLSTNQLSAQLSNAPGGLTSASNPIDQKIEEVYGKTFFVNDAQLRSQFVRLLQHRIKYVVENQRADEKYIHLNSIPLLNKFNPSLVRDAIFNETDFNPLKYQMEFWSKKTEVYRINQNVIIVIAPQL